MIADLDKRNASVDLWRKWVAAFEALDNAPEEISDQDYEELRVAEITAKSAYEVAGHVVETASGMDVERCEITGVPLLVSDDVAMVLRSALPNAKEKAA